MRFINTDGASIIGPGSEWFWTAISGVVLAVTFLAIYRQLRLQTSATARQRVKEINEEWRGERMTRRKIATFEALLAGSPMDVDTPLVWETVNFWENVASMTRHGHIDLGLIKTDIGHDVAWWWTVMGPACRTARDEAHAWDLFIQFEWLANEMLKTGSGVVAENSRPSTPEVLQRAAASARASVALEESLRTVRYIPEISKG
jgi:hypothetical protein